MMNDEYMSRQRKIKICLDNGNVLQTEMNGTIGDIETAILGENFAELTMDEAENSKANRIQFLD